MASLPVVWERKGGGEGVRKGKRKKIKMGGE